MKNFIAGWAIGFLIIEIGIEIGKTDGDSQLAAMLILPVVIGLAAWGLLP